MSDEELSRAMRETAAALRPDVTRLLDGGLERGRRKRRARRLRRIGGSAAGAMGVAAVCAALVAVGPRFGSGGGAIDPAASVAPGQTTAPGALVSGYAVGKDYMEGTIKACLLQNASVAWASPHAMGTPTTADSPDAFGGMEIVGDNTRTLGWIQVEIGAVATPVTDPGWTVDTHPVGVVPGGLRATYVRSDGARMEVLEYAKAGGTPPLDQEQLRAFMLNAQWGEGLQAAVTARGLGNAGGAVPRGAQDPGPWQEPSATGG